MRDERSDLTRRGFLRTSIAGLAAAGLAGIGPRLAAAEGVGDKANLAPETADPPDGKMIHRDLGKTGIRVPIVGMGAMNSENPEIVKASYEAGVRHFDTAAVYAFGRNEQMLGKVIKEMGVRDKVVIGTKEHVVRRTGMTDAEVKSRFLKLADGSLARLQTDYVDIMYLHDVQSVDALDQACFDAMNELKNAGKARATGVSTHQSMTEVINEVVERRLCDVVLAAINVSMAGDQALLDAVGKAAAAGIGIVAMKTQAGGRQLPNREALARYDTSTINTAVLKWVLRNQAVATAIPGYTSYQQMKEDVSVASGLEYTEEEKRFLADNQLQIGLGFCRQCRQCVATCPQAVDIPALMRVHMYAAQYSNFAQARATMDEIPHERGPAACASCTECSARCANWVDIAYRMGELRLMYG